MRDFPGATDIEGIFYSLAAFCVAWAGLTALAWGANWIMKQPAEPEDEDGEE